MLVLTASVARVWVGTPWQLPVGTCLSMWPSKWGSVPHPQIELFSRPILSSCYLSYGTMDPGLVRRFSTWGSQLLVRGVSNNPFIRIIGKHRYLHYDPLIVAKLQF